MSHKHRAKLVVLTTFRTFITTTEILTHETPEQATQRLAAAFPESIREERSRRLASSASELTTEITSFIDARSVQHAGECPEKSREDQILSAAALMAAEGLLEGKTITITIE